MKGFKSSEMVTFTTKGQVVIPSRIRRAFEIEEGTRALVIATAEGILLKPITAATIRQARGIISTKLSDKSLHEELAEHKRRETGMEEK